MRRVWIPASAGMTERGGNETLQSYNMKKIKFLILITVFIDAIGIGIIVPIMPFFVGRFSSSPLLMTSLFSVFALCSFLSAPVIGAWSDKIGRKAMLVISIFSTSLGWAVFAGAPSIFFLFLGRIIDGCAAGNFPIAQAYLIDIARDDKERTTNLGLIGAVFGLAFIVGPFLGGALGAVSHAFPFWFVAALALVNGILGIFFLPETNRNRGASHGHVSLNPFIPLKRALQDKPLVPNYAAWFLFGIAISAFMSVFALYAQRMFGLQEFAIGLLFSVMGVIIALNQSIALRHFWLKYFQEPTLELMLLVIFAVGFLLMSAGGFSLFIAGLVGVIFGQSVLRVVMNSQIASQADPMRKGEALGIASSVASLSMVVGPFAAGYLFDYNARIPFVMGALVLLGAFFILYKKRNVLKGQRLSAEVPIVSEI